MDSSTLANNQAARYDYIQRVLRQYQLTAPNSLGGPAAMLAMASDLDGVKTPSSAVSTALANFILHRENADPATACSNLPSACHLNDLLGLRQAIPVQPFPGITPNDRTSTAAEKQETVLEGEYIACFAVGGEKRLCFPQIIGSVLKNLTLVDINKARTDLSIHCNHCGPEQLQVLKAAGVLPSTATNCSLITKTDAERLCNYLLRQKQDGVDKPGAHAIKREYRRVQKPMSSGHDSQIPNGTGTTIEVDKPIPVMHLCFGRCRGRYHSTLYASPSAECIECDECGDLLAPDRFVMHSHRNQERRTCHWGFDSANWRAYIHLPSDSESSIENTKLLEQMKLRFDVTGLTKRKFEEYASDDGSSASEDDAQSSKRFKSDKNDQAEVTNGGEKLAISLATTTPTVLGSGMEQRQPYFLLDPLFLTIYQALLSGAAKNPMTAPIHQAGGASCTPSMQLPPLNGSDGLAPSTKYITNLYQQQQQLQSGPVPSRGQLPILNATTTTDEATAAAALKLLQLRAFNDNQAPQAPMTEKNGDQMDKNAAPSLPPDRPLPNQVPQNHSSWSPANKEPFKKHLLHLFAVEQKQKEILEQQKSQQQQEQQQQQQVDSGRASVEVIVDGDDDDEIQTEQASESQQVNEASFSSNSEKCADESNETTETQMADETSSNSDTEGNPKEEASLDDLLNFYISDSNGLRAVRQRIAANQRYLEQSLESVTAENRILRAECFQLKTKHYQLQQEHERQQQQQNVAATGLNFLNLLQRPLKF